MMLANRGTVARIFYCILFTGWIFYAYIHKQNEKVELQLLIPLLSKEVNLLKEENTRLKYEIDCFESPLHLMELARKPEFSHLKYPYTKDVLIVTQPHLTDF